jgi:nitronate monooxygenase
MGAGVSSWSLANAVSKIGQLGVVAGTGMDGILARRLQLGDESGHVRRALAAFPIAGVARRIIDRYFVPGGKAHNAPFKSHPVLDVKRLRISDELVVAGNFVEVFLAREGHHNPVGINFLEKIQIATLPGLFGAMLAGVGVVLMGAGIPRTIPGVLDRLAAGEPVELRLDVDGADKHDAFYTRFDPSAFCESTVPPLTRPKFLSIISSITMAKVMAKKATGKVDGFVIEGPSAGGHNAPPRGQMLLSESNEPIYSERDAPDIAAIAAMGIPFWLAGSYAHPKRLAEARAVGAAGIQVGTAFAFCEESGMTTDIKTQVLAMSGRGELNVYTDPLASPTGFPFKIAQVPGTVSDPKIADARPRLCDLGILRRAYKKEDGTVGWRCPGEPAEMYLRKGGKIEDTVGKQCVCNGLVAAVGYGGVRKDGYREMPMVTSGDDVKEIARFVPEGASTYSAADVVDYLLS